MAMIMAAVPVRTAEMTLSNSNSPRAPLTVSKGKSPSASLSREERKDLIQEFRGLLSFGTKNHPLASWKGRSMADCYAPQQATDRWAQKCEIITGQGNGFYYFYGGDAVKGPTLQHVEVFLQTSDQAMLAELRPTLRRLFGTRELVVQNRPGVAALGSIWHWNTGEEFADLFLDAHHSTNGTVHFVWTRAPLATTKQAKAL